MIDTIIVAAIVVIAAIFVGRKLVRPFTMQHPTCNCTGCGQSEKCSGIQDSPKAPDCCGPR